MSEHLDRLARRVADDPFFLAPALGLYAQSEALDDAALAARLGCDLAALSLLRLCRMPRLLGADFMNDVRTIAARFALDLAALAQAVRCGQNLLRLQQTAGEDEEGSRRFLLAARDGEPEPPAETAEEGQS